MKVLGLENPTVGKSHGSDLFQRIFKMSILQFVLKRFNCLSLGFSVEKSRHSGALNIAYDGFFQISISNKKPFEFRV